MSVKSRLSLALSRARYAAVGAAVGAAIGGLFSRSSASTGGATGALIGAAFAEKRHSTGGWLAQLKSGDETDGPAPNKVLDQVKDKKEQLSKSS